MAYVGLRKIIIAERTGAKTYGEPFAFGKAIGMNVTPNYSEGSLNADDVQAEYDKEFNYAELSMNTSTVPLEAHDTMFGHTVNENAVDFNTNDEAKYVGQGWIAPEKVDGKKYYTGNFLYKAKYSEPSEEYTTKGDSIEYKTPSISGRALAEDDGDWKATERFDTPEKALAWIYKKFGKTEMTQAASKNTAPVKA